jgi:hypothetical protein
LGIHLVSTTIDTSGDIKFDGALTLYSDQNISSSAGIVTFTSSINSDSSSTPRALTVNAGTGSIVFGGAIGSTYALRNLTASGSGGITINASVTTATGYCLKNSIITLSII